VLTGRTAVVTGASRGIGRAIANVLAGCGADIVLNYARHEEAAQAARMEIEAIGRRCLVVRANLGEPRQVEGLVAEAASFAAHGIYAFVHCAAIGVFKPVLGVRPSQFDLSMSVNARSFLDAARCLRPVMTPRDARMIAISGQGARAVVREYGPVGVSKAALESLVRYLAVELAPDGIRVNALSSGLIDTDAVRSFPDAAERLDRVARDTPLGRLGQPEDIANVVALLCSPDAAWITGQVVVADGGYGLLAR
jgi:enoyl-[acyl-carrier protein] reductase III